MKWLRLYTDVKDDPKIRKMELEEQAVFFLLLTIAAEEDKEGIIPMEAEDIAWSLRIPVDLAKKTIKKCLEREILLKDRKGFKLINWEKRQFPSDHRKDYWKDWRSTSKCNVAPNVAPNVEGNVAPNVECNALDRYIEREIDRDIFMSPAATETISEDTPPVCVSTETIPHEAIVALYTKHYQN